jgi:uncharacterized protein (DUF697 family)
MEPDKVAFYLRKLGETVENRVTDAIKGRDADRRGDRPTERPEMPPMRNENMDFMEPDWDDIDRKADMIVARYAVVSAAMNILPLPFDVMGVTGTFSKMATELAGVYQVIVSNKRARQMGWAIATTTASVLGIAYTGSKLAKFIPGGYWIATAVQAPLVGAIAWAAGDALKNYFKQCRQGREPSIQSLSESFANTLRIRLKKAKVETPATAPEAPAATPAAPTNNGAVSNAVDKIAGLHELLRAGAITQEEFDRAKAELLAKL